MQTDPAGEWLRLAEEYRAKSDEELRELAADFAELTEPAQQALRQEMHSRKLGDPAASGAQAPGAIALARASNAPAQRVRSTPDLPEPDIPADVFPGNFGHPPALVSDDSDDATQEDTGGAHDYTWKTVLGECETTDEARYLADALHNAGLDAWVEPSREFGRSYARVLVAADQLEQARAIAARPIPQDIVDESKVEVPEFVEPKCPKCGSNDVVLEGVDTANRWHCETCDAEWSDAAEVAEGSPGSAGSRPA
jgi:ribosomal protein L37AE/L43A/cell division septation protein DedD